MSKASQSVAIERHIIEDDRLSLEARAVFVYLLSRPEGYRFKAADLFTLTANTRHKSGRIVIYRILTELIALGYLSRQKFKGGDVRYTIHAAPLSHAKTAAGAV